ncbi:MAG: alpha/beta fold hydrolase [Dehalococcoidia bacterium]|nr:alpha/beta fold hydrolase [Dehalococcoidia bacterium]
MPRATVNGIDTEYEVRGDGVPVLFIHGGYGGHASTLAPLAEPQGSFLAEAGRAITYDRRCAYRSQYVLHEYDLADIASDAFALLDHLEVPRAVVVGSSAGGPVALQFALTWPERVIALALPNTGAALMSLEPYADQTRYTPAVQQRLEFVRGRLAHVEGARAEGDRAAFEARREELRHPPEAAEGAANPARAAQLRAALEAASDDDLLTYSTGELRNLGAYAAKDLSPRLGELSMPVCIVHGDADERVPIQYGRDLAAGIAQSEFHTIAGAGHGITSNAEARGILVDWVRRVAAGEPATAGGRA